MQSVAAAALCSLLVLQGCEEEETGGELSATSLTTPTTTTATNTIACTCSVCAPFAQTFHYDRLDTNAGDGSFHEFGPFTYDNTADVTVTFASVGNAVKCKDAGESCTQSSERGEEPRGIAVADV